MAIYEFEGKRPRIGKDCYIFESADIIGDVHIGRNVYIGPGARLRGDYGRIIVGDWSSIEDNVVVHARPDEETKIAKSVTVGHGAVLHNCTIWSFCVVGMGSVVSDWARMGEWAVLGEGAVVKNRQILEPGDIAVGVPARVVGKVNVEYKHEWTRFKAIYNELAKKRYPEGMKKLSLEDLD
jgi:carbonic anhydrase/acetyltransferase-like protein (isoleucine patch superfamily)